MDLFTLLSKYAALEGIAAFVAVLINLGKVVGIVKDGTSAKWSLGLNSVLFALVVIAGLFAAPIEQSTIDTVARVLAAVLGFILQLITSPFVHTKLVDAELPVIGRSFTVSMTP